MHRPVDLATPIYPSQAFRLRVCTGSIFLIFFGSCHCDQGGQQSRCFHDFGKIIFFVHGCYYIRGVYRYLAFDVVRRVLCYFSLF